MHSWWFNASAIQFWLLVLCTLINVCIIIIIDSSLCCYVPKTVHARCTGIDFLQYMFYNFVGIVVWCVQSFGFISRNPVLKNITEYLVDEGSYEEEALLGMLP